MERIVNLTKLADGKLPTSLGRNGSLYTSAVMVTASPENQKSGLNGYCDLTAISSRGVVASCSIGLPSDPKVLRELARALVETAKELEK